MPPTSRPEEVSGAGLVRRSRWSRPTTWRCSTSTAWSTSATRRCPARRRGRRRGPRGGDCGSPSSPTTPRAPRQAVGEDCASSGCRPSRTTWSPRRRRPRSVLAERFGAGARDRVLWAPPASSEALTAAGLEPVGVDDDDAAALVTGYGPDVVWRDVMRAAVRVRDGLPWVASNTDLTIPTAFGIAPGHGVMVRMLRRLHAASTPTVAGKPAAAAVRRDRAPRRRRQRPLMVGDRLDTDIEGAAQRRDRLAPGDDGRHRPGGPGRGAGASCGRRTSPRDLAGLLEPHAAPGAIGLGVARGRLAGGRDATGASRSTGTGTRTTGGGWWRPRPGPTSTTPGSGRHDRRCAPRRGSGRSGG